MSDHHLSAADRLNRAELAKYLNRVGRGINCRMDVPVLVESDIKWASKVLNDLSRELQKLGWDDDRPEIYRILAARSAIESARSELQQVNRKDEAVKAWKKAQGKPA